MRILAFLIAAFLTCFANENFSQNVSEILEERNLSPEEEKFLKFDEECSKGDSWSCSEVGMTLYKSYDLVGAYAYFDKACQIEFGVGCELKAFILTTYESYDEAFEIFTKACDNNSSYSCLNLAKLYDDGHGTKKDHKKATELYLKSCKLGDHGACNMLNLR